MKKLFSVLLSIMLISTVMFGCAPKAENAPADSDKLLIVTTNSILADMVYNVVGDNADIYSIVPIGTDPHEYEPLPKDIEAVSDSDIIFYNGLNLETGGNGWFVKLMETTGKVSEKDYFVVSSGVEPMYLTSAGKENEQDPHAWLDIQNGIKYVENIISVVSEKDSKYASEYNKNGKEYIAKLEELDKKAKNKMSDIPDDKKLLVSSEGAFKYFSKAYGLTAAYIWEINTESQGTPEQMTRIIDTIRDWEVPSLFVETSVDHRSMEQVSSETGIPIYSTIFTDSLAKQGEEGDSYYDMMKWNLDKIHEGLSS